MANIEKLIDKMKNQPNGIRLEEAEKVLIYFNYLPVRQKGSHKHYLNEKTGDLITIKQETPLKKVYIIDILNRVKLCSAKDRPSSDWKLAVASQV